MSRSEAVRKLTDGFSYMIGFGVCEKQDWGCC